MKHTDSSSAEPPRGIDRLSTLMDRFRVRAQLFHAGPLCGVTRFAAEPGLGFLHVMRRGEMEVTHRARSGAPKRLRVREPSLLFYPRPLAHDFHNAPTEGADFACATLAFDGGPAHPLARALPPLVVLPLARVQELQHTLALLFSETERLRCGQRLLADRLFEVLLLQLLRWLIDHPEEGGLSEGVLAGLAHPRLAAALTAMHERPGEAWSLEALARCAGMSRSAFAQAFKAEVGETPADYLARWRLAIAQTELRAGRSLKQIAGELGYANPSALSRVFAQKLGVAPRDWLKQAAA
jgi:AraC-like DNA-binding protein